ncbi:MAG: anthranilate phosphoribosyltransferase, partial [Phycisphaerae bacterium]
MIPFIQKLSRGEDLTLQEAREAMRLIMEGRAEPAQIAAFLVALSIKGPTPDEIAGAALVMREKATRIDVGDLPVIDTCGTGGTGKKPFNVSTCAALVAAGAGAYVAKHGNRGATSRCGSSDVLETLGVNVQAPPAVVARCIREAHIGFLFAPLLHGAMKHAAPVRKAIGIPTVFNVLGPLTNPAGARRQVMGVFAPDLVRLIAEVMVRLGVEHGLVVHSSEGLDEITLSGPAHVAEVQGGRIREYDVTAADLGLPEGDVGDMRVETAAQGAEIVRAILGGEKGAKRNLVLANAAAAIYVAGLAET